MKASRGCTGFLRTNFGKQAINSMVNLHACINIVVCTHMVMCDCHSTVNMVCCSSPAGIQILYRTAHY